MSVRIIRIAPTCILVVVLTALRVIASTSSIAVVEPISIHNCNTAKSWFHKEHAYRITLDARQAQAHHYARPIEPDSLDIHFLGATYYRGTVGGGGCLGGYYDETHRIAAILSAYDTYDDNLLFVVKQPVRGFTEKNLASVKTDRGARLGMTMSQIIAIEGRGTTESSPNGEETWRYEWFKPMPGSNLPLTFALTFLFDRGRVVAIDYGKGV